MANTYKNIVISPNIGNNTNEPRIQFSGANTSANTDINLYVYPTTNGTLSFEGSAGQLFSITNDLSNSIFAVNDVSGIPSIEVFANGLVSVAQYSGNVGIGNTTPGHKLSVNGAVAFGNSTITGFVNATTTLAAGNTTITGFVNATSTLAAGNTTITGFVNASTNVTTNTIWSTNVYSTFANSTTVNATTINATTVNANLTGNVVATTVNATANITVGANALINTSALLLSNSTARLLIDAGDVFVGNTSITSTPQILVQNTAGTTTINSNFISTTSLSGNLTGNVVATTVNATANVTVGASVLMNTSTFAVGTGFTANSTVVNAVSFNVGATVVANATHLYGVTATNYARTDISEAFDGVITFNANSVITKLLSANSSFGTTNQFLRTGVTTNTYWGSLTSSDVTTALGYTPGTGTVTSVAAGTGLSSTGTTAVTISMPATGPGAGSYSGGISAITIDAQGRITAITGSAGYSTGDITSVTASTGLTGGGTTGAVSLAVDGTAVLFLNDAGPLTAGLRINGSGLGASVAVPAAGAISAAGDITAFASDERFKEDVETISDALEKVKKIRGVTYRHNALAEALGLEARERMAGVIAQEVEAVLPEVVTLAPLDTEYDEERNKYSISGENYKTVKYDKMIPLLIEAIKELSDQVEELKKRLGE